MKIVEIRDFAATAALRAEWNGLLDATGSNSIFLTWEWFQSWWPSYAEPGWQLRLVLIYSDDGALRGMAALREQTHTRRGLTVRALRFAVDGSNDSEYLDVLIHPDAEAQTRFALNGWLERQLASGLVLQWNELPEASGSVAALQTLCGQGCTVQRVACATAPLPQDFETYVAGLKPRFRTKVRSVLRAFSEDSNFEFGFCETAEEAVALLPPLFALHTRRWEADGERGVFWWDRKREFYRNLTARLAIEGTLRFSWLRCRGQVLACQYGFLRGGTYFHLQEGYEPEAEHRNCGIGLRAWSIRELIRQGVREYDFLGGINRHKTDWGAVEKKSLSVESAGAGWKNWAYRSVPAWETAFRESARAVLPGRVFELRHQLRASANPAGAAFQITASAYYHSGVLPALARRVRERYALVRNGKLHLEQRTAPRGRILYFHRVNDEHDPFFPAMDTALFDRQMRYLARHYEVVSLAQMLQRLDDRVPGDMLAITFDDGYRDNLENALPILERYGLPATIFLTTAPMDSREPMWFERLAGAFRDTTCDRLDLEIDIPRRYLLRNREERLRANDRVYEQLRQLPNAERVTWLDRVLDQLGRPSLASRQGRMLTWDDVRQMSRRGIDFGGHTVNHPFLSRLSGEGILAEASGCRVRIEEELQKPVRHFAYPSGRASDFGLDNAGLIRAAGYEAAVTTIWGLNDSSTDRMTLRRGGPWEERADLFAAKLDWYQLVNG